MIAVLARRDRYGLRIELCGGFREHTVVIEVDRREVYRRAAVTTDPATSRADAVDIAAGSPYVHLAVSVAPGSHRASLDLDLATHRQVAISLVGEATVSFEMSP